MSSKSVNPNRPLTPWQKNWQRFNPWLESCAIAAWGIALLRLCLTGKLYLLIHPNYIPLTLIAGVLLTAIGFMEAWRVWQRRQSSRQSHITLVQPSLGSSLLLAVAIASFLIEPRPFTSEKAIHRGVIEGIADSRNIPQSFRSSNRPEQRTLVEWVRTVSAYPEPDAYKGQRVNVSGFVVHPPDRPENIFLITRFIITCCAADVYPVSLPVRIAGNRSSYPRDRWFRVEGQIDVEGTGSKRQVIIAASNITAIEEPKNPYDY